MLLLRGFFRKKSTKIYLVIFSAMLSCVMSIFMFISYYDVLIDKIYSRSSIVLISDKFDYFKELSNLNPTNKIEEILILKPNKEIRTIMVNPIIIDGIIINKEEVKLNEGTEDRISWAQLMYYKFDSLLTYPSSRQNLELDNNEVAIGINTFDYNEMSRAVKNIIGKPIGFYFNDNPIEFTIAEVYPTQWPEILVSETVYTQMYESKQTYSYKTFVSSEKEANQLNRELEKIRSNNEMQISVSASFNSKDGDNETRFKDLIYVLKLVSYAVIFIFGIIFNIIIKNVINDDKKNILFKTSIGYSKWQIKKNIIIQLIMLGFLSLVFSYLLSIFLSLVVNYGFDLNLKILSFKILFIISLIVLSALAFVGLKTQIRINDKL